MAVALPRALRKEEQTGHAAVGMAYAALHRDTWQGARCVNAAPCIQLGQRHVLTEPIVQSVAQLSTRSRISSTTNRQRAQYTSRSRMSASSSASQLGAGTKQRSAGVSGMTQTHGRKQFTVQGGSSLMVVMPNCDTIHLAPTPNDHNTYGWFRSRR